MHTEKVAVLARVETLIISLCLASKCVLGDLYLFGIRIDTAVQ